MSSRVTKFSGISKKCRFLWLHFEEVPCVIAASAFLLICVRYKFVKLLLIVGYKTV